MTTLEKAPTILTEVGARRLTDRLHNTLTAAHELLIEAWQGRAWEALGYANWTAYCQGELGELLHVRLPVNMRREVVAEMRAAGMSIRNIAAPLGVSIGTVATDLHPVAPKPPEPAETLTAWQRAVRSVAAQGERGLTSLEYELETGLRHGAASAALHAAEKKGHVRRGATMRRGYAAYRVV